MDYGKWRNVTVPETIATGDEAAVQEIIDAEVESSSRNSRAQHVMSALIMNSYEEMKPRERVRWDLVAHVAKLEYAEDARRELVKRVAAAARADRVAFPNAPEGIGADSFYAEEVTAVHHACRDCLNLGASSRPYWLIEAARRGHVSTVANILGRIDRSVRSDLCSVTAFYGSGPLDVAKDPAIVRMLEACGARRHTAEESEAIRQSVRDEARRRGEERQEAERMGAIRERQRREEDNARARANAARASRESDAQIGAANAAWAASAGAEQPSASGGGDAPVDPIVLTVTKETKTPRPAATIPPEPDHPTPPPLAPRCVAPCYCRSPCDKPQ